MLGLFGGCAILLHSLPLNGQGKYIHSRLLERRGIYIRHSVSGLVLNVPGGHRRGQLRGVNLWTLVPKDPEQQFFAHSLTYDRAHQVITVSAGGGCLNFDYKIPKRPVSVYDCVGGDPLQHFITWCSPPGGRRACLLQIKKTRYGDPRLCLQSQNPYAQWVGTRVVLAPCDFSFNTIAQWWESITFDFY